MPEVRELTLEKLGPEGGEAKLTLADDKLVVETADDSPMPEWLRGEMAFDDLDIAYVDPSAEEDELEEGEKPMPPGLRVACWIEMPAAEGDETLPRKATITVDGDHADMEQAQAFAATFAKLAGREEPEAEEAEEEAPAEEIPTGAPEEPAVQTPAEEAPAESAFAAPEEDDTPAFTGSDAFAAPDDEDDSPAFAASDDE